MNVECIPIQSHIAFVDIDNFQIQSCFTDSKYDHSKISPYFFEIMLWLKGKVSPERVQKLLVTPNLF